MVIFYCGVNPTLLRRNIRMDFVAQILAMVEELLAFLGEFEAAGIIDIIENFFANFLA